MALDVEEVANESAAHVLDLAHEVWRRGEPDLVVDDAPNRMLPSCPVRGPCEDVHLVPGGVERRCEFRNVRRHASCGDGVEGLPGKHRDPQRTPSDDAVFGGFHGADDLLERQHALGLRGALNELGHAPFFVAVALQERSERLGQGRSLSKVEPQATLGDRLAQRREASELVGNHHCLGVHFVHELVGQHQVDQGTWVQLVARVQELLHGLLVGGDPGRVVDVDHLAHPLHTEAIDAVFGHPERQASEKISKNFRLFVVEDARSGGGGEAFLAAGEEVAAKTILTASDAIVGDAHQDPDAELVGLAHEGHELLGGAEEPGGTEEAEGLFAHGGHFLALQKAHEQQVAVAVASNSRKQSLHTFQEASCLILPREHAQVAFVDASGGLGPCRGRLRERLRLRTERPDDRVEEPGVLSVCVSVAPRRDRPVVGANLWLDEELVLGTLFEACGGRAGDLSGPDVGIFLGGDEGRGRGVPAVEVASEEDGLRVGDPLLVGPLPGALVLEAEELVAVSDLHQTPLHPDEVHLFLEVLKSAVSSLWRG
mmetsp:Transcript_2077/g.4819  ORF Transcript_2077/g.4819 Transcript_2077/m.4819 type:complete len:541 (+) Transcript_2077:1686-3308(+)